jgi:hypothetical protein
MSQLRSRTLLAAALVAVALVVAVAGQPAAADSSSSLVFPPTAHVGGKSLGDWGAEWWTWMGQYPLAESPITDDGAVEYGDADEQPAGNTWFLAGTFGGPGERWLTVPKGTRLLVPLINWDVWSPEDCWWIGASTEPDGCTADDLHGFLDTFMTENVTDLSATLDGESIPDLFDYRARSDAFALDIEPDTLWTDFGYTPGTRDPNVSDGYYLLFKPLSEGEHELHFSAEVDGSTIQDMTYHLTVE